MDHGFSALDLSNQSIGDGPLRRDSYLLIYR
jgi:hypothetical protein